MRRLALMLTLIAAPAMAQPDDENWQRLAPRFESTGGGGVMISECDPIILDDRCATPFTATLPDGRVFRNIAVFQALPVQGGVLGPRARWSAVDRSAQGTSPIEVFIGQGVSRRSP